MNKVKYKKGISNFGHDGKEYPADKNGEAEMPDAALAAAIEFGVLAGPDEQPEQEASGNGGVDEALEAEKIAFAEENSERLLPILKGTVLEVIDELPKLSLQELELLGKLELLGQSRKGIAEAVAEEIANFDLR